MAHPRLLIALALLWGCEPSKVVGYGEFDPDAPKPAVYELKEWTFEYGGAADNPFAHYVEVEVSRGNERYEIDGFYDGVDADGDHVYKARFMPSEPGAWSYKWRVGDNSGGDVLDVQERRDLNNHGHVRVDKTTPTVLWHDDGTVHYWFGGKAFTARNYGLPEKEGQQNQNASEASGHDAHTTDEDFKAYLDLMQDTGHNGTRLKIGLYPLADDGQTWDLAWIRRAEQWIAWMQQRHIYCQITFFDPAARAKTRWFEASDDPDQHPLNAWREWDEADEAEAAARQNYIRYIVARFAAYWNVYWELVDRVDAFGTEAGDTFVALANEYYLPWLRSHDPYDLPIGASAAPRARQMPQIDIEFSRDDETRRLTSDSRRAVVLNEMVDTCFNPDGESPAQNDATIRDESNRQCYRAALWRAFVSGAFGANEASWLDLSQPLRQTPVEDVMRDHALLRSIVTGLHVGLDELVYNPGFVESMNQPVGTRAKLGQLYVAYFAATELVDPTDVRVPSGQYTYCWLNPEAPDPKQPDPDRAEPTWENARAFEVESDLAALELPSEVAGDRVLVVERQGDGNPRRQCLPW